MTELAAHVRVIEETSAYWRVLFDHPPFNIVDATIGRLPRRILTVLRNYELTVEAAMAMTDAELIKLHKLGHRGLDEFRRATRNFGG